MKDILTLNIHNKRLTLWVKLLSVLLPFILLVGCLELEQRMSELSTDYGTPPTRDGQDNESREQEMEEGGHSSNTGVGLKTKYTYKLTCNNTSLARPIPYF